MGQYEQRLLSEAPNDKHINLTKSGGSNKPDKNSGAGWGNVVSIPSSDTASEDGPPDRLNSSTDLVETSVEYSTDAEGQGRAKEISIDDLSDLSTDSERAREAAREAAEAAREAKRILEGGVGTGTGTGTGGSGGGGSENWAVKHGRTDKKMIRSDSRQRSTRRSSGDGNRRHGDSGGKEREESINRSRGRPGEETGRSNKHDSKHDDSQNKHSQQRGQQQTPTPTHKKPSDHFRSVGYISLVTTSEGMAGQASRSAVASVYSKGSSSKASSRGTTDSNSSKQRLVESIKCSQVERPDGADDAATITTAGSTVRTQGTQGTLGSLGTSRSLARSNSAAVKRVAPLGTVMSLDQGDDSVDGAEDAIFAFGPVDVDEGTYTNHTDIDSIVRKYAAAGSPSRTPSSSHSKDFAYAVQQAHRDARRLRAEGLYLHAIESYSSVLHSHVGAYSPSELPHVASALHHLAVLHTCAGMYDDALTLCEEALGMRRECLGKQHMDVASTLCELGVVKYARGEFDIALKRWWEALQIVSAHASASSDDSLDQGTKRGAKGSRKGGGSKSKRKGRLASTHPHAVRILNNMGCAHYESARYKSALATFLKAAELRRETLGSVRGVGAAGALLDVSTALCNAGVSVLAGCCSGRDGQAKGKGGEEEEEETERERAAALLEEGLMLQRSVLGDGHRKVLGTEAALASLDSSSSAAATTTERGEGSGAHEEEGHERPLSPVDRLKNAMLDGLNGRATPVSQYFQDSEDEDEDKDDEDSSVGSVRSGVCILSEL